MSMKKDQQLRIKAYLDNPQKHPRPQEDDQRHFVYLLTFLGEMFIQGYRIIEQFDNILIFSLMEFQISQSLTAPEKRSAKKLPSRYKGVLWQYDESICDIASLRKSLFSKMAQVSLFFSEIEFNIIYLHTAKYSILTRTQLQRGTLPTCKDYYKKIQWIQLKNAFKPLQEKDEGIQLHRLAELYIKGAGEARDLEIIRRMQSKNKFCYDLFYVIHTICYVVGKEMLENDYQSISSEKWMRFTTQKRFKRYDLLLRSEDKSGIIDWKFSKLVAQQKIKGNGVKNKNKLYYQLAYKDFLTDVQLKFYCFHARVFLTCYHYFTCASYFHKIPIEYIDKMEEIISIELDDESQNQNAPEQSNKVEKQIEEISVKSSSLQVNLERSKNQQANVINLDEDDIQSKSTQKENKNQIKDNEDQPKILPPIQQAQSKSKALDDNAPISIPSPVKQTEKKLEEKFSQEGLESNGQRTIKNMKKSDIKQAKFKGKFIDLTKNKNSVIDVIDID